ncbi:unnamed protein product [Arabis nemorensis]|uniref:Uncharacterized protein n=1 Tax=Arabis nemorensis TaxID=586526 RepID=A0A565BQ56_9BRAS|nr:unnamed protein product [Arabis nemorensis]
MASFKQSGIFSSVSVSNSKVPVSSKLPSTVGLRRRCPIPFSMEQRRPSMVALAKKKKLADQETEPPGKVPSCKQPLITKVDEELCLQYEDDVGMFKVLLKEVSHQYDVMKLKTNLLQMSNLPNGLPGLQVFKHVMSEAIRVVFEQRLDVEIKGQLPTDPTGFFTLKNFTLDNDDSVCIKVDDARYTLEIEGKTALYCNHYVLLVKREEEAMKMD